MFHCCHLTVYEYHVIRSLTVHRFTLIDIGIGRVEFGIHGNHGILAGIDDGIEVVATVEEAELLFCRQVVVRRRIAGRSLRPEVSRRIRILQQCHVGKDVFARVGQLDGQRTIRACSHCRFHLCPSLGNLSFAAFLVQFLHTTILGNVSIVDSWELDGFFNGAGSRQGQLGIVVGSGTVDDSLNGIVRIRFQTEDGLFQFRIGSNRLLVSVAVA